MLILLAVRSAWQVFGDVCQGAVVRSSGDIIILGRLAGKVHAGAAVTPPNSHSTSLDNSSARKAVSQSPQQAALHHGGGQTAPMNPQAVVVAMAMQPAVLAIATAVVAGPEVARGQPEIARLADNGSIW